MKFICIFFFIFRGEQARNQALAAAEAVAAQQAAMAAIEADSKNEIVMDNSSSNNINFSKYSRQIVSLLARSFYNLKYAALFLAFAINFMLLFFKVKI